MPGSSSKKRNGRKRQARALKTIAALEPRIRKKAYLYGGRTFPAIDEDDLQQEAKLAIVNTLDRYDPDAHGDTPVGGYLHLRIRGSMLDAVRREKKQSYRDRQSCWDGLPTGRGGGRLHDPGFSAIEDQATRLPDASADTEAEAARRLLSELLLRAARESLTDRYLKVIVLLYGKGLTMREVGVLMGVEESRICQMKKFALAQMRTRLEQLGIRGVGDAMK